MSLLKLGQAPAAKKDPVMACVQVSLELDPPFLVSQAKLDRLLTWVEKLSQKDGSGRIWAAVRKAPLEFMYREAVQEAAEKASALGWGSVHPRTRQGFLEASGHLEEYGMREWEVLYGKGFDTSLLDQSTKASEQVWMPEGEAVVVPVQRAYLGTATSYGEGRYSLVIHNPSRAMAFLK